MEQTITDWSLLESDWTANQYETYQCPVLPYTYYGEPPPNSQVVPLPPSQAQHHIPPPSPPRTPLLTADLSAPAILRHGYVPFPRGDNPREIRNKAEKQRRDKLNQSIAELAAMVPPVVAASRKIDKTGVLRLTAHYLRAHQYVFGDTLARSEQDFSPSSTQAVLGFLRGFLLTTTYKGIIVVVSQNVNQYLGYSELELLGQNLFNITHEDDRQLLKEQLMPKSHLLGLNGELLVPDEPDGRQKVGEALAMDKRRFVVRFKKLAKRSEPIQYLSCHVEGCLRKSDRACRGYNRCCQMVRRTRARGDNPCSSGNDVVFVGIVRPTTETFQSESNMESFRMEYRTRHSVDGEIIQCEQRIALVTGYMTHEVHGVNAMNFMHRDDVRWVIIALREMYDSHRLVGESCYRLMTKSGQFIYMRTRGQLDVNQDSCAVTSFVCTNSVVEETEGKHLIRMMKRKFTMLVNNNDKALQEHERDEADEDTKDSHDDKIPPVEDPRQLEKVILHLVTNLPSPQPEDDPNTVTANGDMSLKRLAIIPPKKERIVSAIGNIYKVLKNIDATKLPDEPTSTKQNDPQPSTSNSDTPPTKVVLLAPTKPIATYDVRKSYKTLSSNNTVLRSSINTNETSSNVITPTENLKTTVTSTIVEPQRTSSNRVQVIFKIANASESSNRREVDSAQPGQSGTASTLKRSNEFEDDTLRTKKKVQAVDTIESCENKSRSNSPSLESFFDEAILNTNIESVIRDLERGDFPSFPDLLISSNDVNEILAEIEKEAQEQDMASI